MAAARAALLLAPLLLASCRRSPPPPSASAASASAPSLGASAAAPAPGPFDFQRDALAHEASALEPLAQALVEAVAQKKAPEALAAYRALRERYRGVEPAARLMAKLACSQIGAYAFFEPTEGGPTGLPALGRVLRSSPPDLDAALPLARRVHQAAKLLPGELAMQDWTPQKLGFAMSEAAFVFALRLDGSDSFDEEERASDTRAELAGLARASIAVAAPIEVADPAAAAEIRREVRRLGNLLAPGPEVSPETNVISSALLSSGRLGSALRRGFRALGGEAIQPPFRPRHGDPATWPVSPLTFPALPGATPAAADVALGKALFSSKKLSRNGDISCASCHDEKQAFARLDPPTLTFEKKAPPRNAPSVLNAAYETFFFWDGRASTMAAQIDVAIDRDMGGDWGEVERRLNAEESIATLARSASKFPLTAAHIRDTVVAYERTLIEDQTRLDRFERGELQLSPSELIGFELFFGKARCSRCHRLPLLSGVQPPRLRRTELSAIGAPLHPDGRDLGPDQGRASITRRDRDRGLFKVPGLRRVAETPPYFHHGGFKTLEQVLSFYEKGGGPGLKIDTPNVDPELTPISLNSLERSHLLTFLRQSLSR